MALKDDGARPPSRLLSKPKSGTFQALEVASSVTSAYDELGSDSEALSKLCPLSQGRAKQSQPQPTQCSGQGPSATSPSNPEAMGSDSETSSTSSSREAGRQARLTWLQRKAPKNPTAEKVRLQGELDVNFNPQAVCGEISDSSDSEETVYTADRRTRRWRRARVGPEEPSRGLSLPGSHPQGLHTHQVRKFHLPAHTHFEVGWPFFMCGGLESLVWDLLSKILLTLLPSNQGPKPGLISTQWLCVFVLDLSSHYEQTPSRTHPESFRLGSRF